MFSRVELVADVADDGTPVLARIHARGQFAVRATGPGVVHLVGTAAGPLGGDVLEVSVRVRAGARLTVRGVAATLALPGREGGQAESGTDLVVDDGAVLDYALPPLVICRAARLRTTTRLLLQGSAVADVAEQVVLGRHGQAGGDWTGRMVADRDGRPVLRSTQRSDLLQAAPTPAGITQVRALVTHLHAQPATQPATQPTTRPANQPLTRPAPQGPAGWIGTAVACPLTGGGVLITAIAADLSTALADATAAGMITTASPHPLVTEESIHT